MAIKKLKSGQWQGDYRDDKGVRLRKTFRLKGDAERFIRDQKKAIDDGTYVSRRQSPLFREMAELWYREKVLGVGCRRRPRPATLAAWRIHIDKHLLPRLGDRKLNQIDDGVMDDLLDDVEKIINDLAAKTELDNPSGERVVFNVKRSQVKFVESHDVTMKVQGVVVLLPVSF